MVEKVSGCQRARARANLFLCVTGYMGHPSTEVGTTLGQGNQFGDVGFCTLDAPFPPNLKVQIVASVSSGRKRTKQNSRAILSKPTQEKTGANHSVTPA